MNAAIETVKHELRKKKIELVEMEKALARIHEVQNDVRALERTLAILQGDSTASGSQASPPSTLAFSTNGQKIHEMAYAVLKEAGRSMDNDELFVTIKQRGCHSSRQSILGAIYRYAKEGKLIIKEGSSRFGLKENALSETS